MSEYTPTKYEVLEAWVAHTSHDHPTAYDLVEAGESFNRWLAAEKAKWQAEALDQVRADIRAEAMIRTYSDPRTFTALEVFDLAKRYTPEWVAKVLSDRIEKGADRG